MSAQLRDLLADLGAQAPNYADPQRALADARARMARRRTLTPVVAFLFVVVLVVVPVLYSHDWSAAPVGTDASPGPVAGYPTQVVPPQLAEPLPWTPLGSAAAFVYAPCARTCDPYLVLTDGRQYALDRPPFGPPTASYTLSPDGVWLGSPAVGGFQLRSPATGQAHFITDSGPGVTDAWAWSPDSSLLLLARHVGGDVDHYLLVDIPALTPPATQSGSRTVSHQVFSRGQIPGTAFAVRNDGDVITWVSGGENGSMPTLTIVDSETVTERARFTLQMPPNAQLLHPGETLEFGPFFIGFTDDTGRVVIHGPPYDRPTGFLGVDLANDGKVWGRNDLPVSAQSGGHGDGVWRVAGLAGGVLLIHSAPDRTEIEVMNDVTGERTVATTLPVDSEVVVRGSARY